MEGALLLLGNLFSPQILTWDLSTPWHAFLPDVDEDDVGKLLAGLLILSDIRGSSVRWFFPRLFPGVVPTRGKDSEAR